MTDGTHRSVYAATQEEAEERMRRHLARHGCPEDVCAVLARETPLERAYRLGEGCGGLDAEGVRRLVELSRGAP